MATAGERPDQAAGPRLTTEQTRIHYPATHRREARRAPVLGDALDFWPLAGAAANVAMQMARPGIGYGVAESKVESGALMVRPWKRFWTTASYLVVAVIGSEEEKRAFREAVNVAHRQVRSEPDAAVKYNAFDRHLQLWVAACLYIVFEDTYQLLHGKMTPDQSESFFQGASSFGTTLQVPEHIWPATREEFDRYWNEAAELAILDDRIRAYIDDLVNLRMINRPMRLVFGGLLKFLTIGYLGPYFRDQMHLPWTAADQRRFDNLFLFVGFANRFLPKFVRRAPINTLMVDMRRRIRHHHALI